MPHKHTRKREEHDKNFDLTPSQVAKSLPAFEKSAKSGYKGKIPPTKDLKRKRNGSSTYKQDDTPQEFRRMMQLHAGEKQHNGLDDGEDRRSKKKKKRKSEPINGETSASTKEPSSAVDKAKPLKILPGERLADFAARVNQALPLSGLGRKGKKVEDVKERQTKTEKRLHKMYAEWRVEEAKRKEKLEEFQEQQEEADEEQEAALGGQSIHLRPSGKKAKRMRIVGEVDDDDGDPWAVLKTKREMPKGLHDVVQAPPTMKVVPKEKFKVRNNAQVDVANVPGAAGSLKRREELGEARKEVIERYRAMMKGSGRL